VEDNAIIELYFQKSENAISETRLKYGRMLRSISFGIVKSMEDAEECENDTYLKTWNTVPPVRPHILSAFLSKITRNLSLDRYEHIHAEKRGGGEVPLLLDELAECIPDKNMSALEQDSELAEILNRFLGSLKKDARIIFMRRYWYGDSITEIAEKSGFSSSKIKMSLLRSRNELKAQLSKEGYTV